MTEIQSKVFNLIEGNREISLEELITKSGLKQIVITNSTNALIKMKKIYATKKNESQVFSIPSPVKEKKDKKKRQVSAKSDDGFLKRDKSKFIYNGEVFGKGRLVLTIIRDYMRKRPRTKFDDLERAWPRQSLQPGYGVVRKLNDARKHKKRFFLDKEDILATADQKFAVTNQWGKANIKLFLIHAKSLGFKVTVKAGK